ncbi:hypothetical protein GGI23_007122 [Coemansia sp. RSA 2559]|nr:hypothetical protein GGI23_007122 [Coemansia sp. RSA 2559]
MPSYPGWAFTASTIAMDMRYCIITTGACFMVGCLRSIVNCRQPAGDIQALRPRPRPASWMVATLTVPLGSSACSLVFFSINVCVEFAVSEYISQAPAVCAFSSCMYCIASLMSNLGVSLLSGNESCVQRTSIDWSLVVSCSSSAPSSPTRLCLVAGSSADGKSTASW